MPRRRRGASAIAVEARRERGLVMRILLHSPKDMVAGALAFAAVSAIIANALFLQAGHHPAPMFGSVVDDAGGGWRLPVRCRVRVRSKPRDPGRWKCRIKPASLRIRSLPSRKPPIR